MNGDKHPEADPNADDSANPNPPSARAPCDGPLEQAIACEGLIPLGWELREELPPESRLAALNGANEALVRSCDGLEEPRRKLDDANELGQELQRLDAKLDLVLELLAEWLQAPTLPPTVQVRFNAVGLCWEAEELPAEGSLLRIELHLCSRIPRPVVLYARVVRVHPSDNGGARAVVEFVGVSEGLADALERMVFRRHRREVAQLRGQRRGPAD